MVQIMPRATGKRHPTHVLELATTADNEATGSDVHLDKSSKHMYELNNQIRLINVQEYPIDTSDGFIGFICGIICQDHDLEQMYLDSFLKLACLEGADIEETYKTLETISEKYHVKFVLSISMNAADLPECAKESVVVSL